MNDETRDWSDIEASQVENREEYFTPPELTKALLSRLELPERSVIYEPCAGDRWIAKVLEERGVGTVCGDISWDAPVKFKGMNFFSKQPNLITKTHRVTGIITNPPWSDAALFVRRALELTPNVAMLLRMTFLEPCAKAEKSARLDLLERLTGVLVLPRTSFIKGKSGTDSVPPAWFVWGFEGCGFPRLDFVGDVELAEHGGQMSLWGQS